MKLNSVRLCGFRWFLPARDNGHNRLKLKVDGRGKTTRTVIVELDKSNYSQKDILEAVESDRVVLNSCRIFISQKNEIAISSRDIYIIPLSDMIYGDKANTGILEMIEVQDDTSFYNLGSVVASNDHYKLAVGAETACSA